ncbi:MAG TPA: methyltransferase domain-containing protein [Polyangiaceae bacterium]|nr:methyltransferase domain-containing protein [Polyangiaceae bacterium]
MPTSSLSSSAALAAFIEPWLSNRRALVFGSALAATPRLLLERGARLVHVCDPSPLRVAEAAERAAAAGLSFSSFSDETLAGPEGAFDCVLVENLGAFDARAVVARVRRLLAPRGVALFVTPNREATAPLLPVPEPAGTPIDYYALYDLVAGEFEHVRMLGQAPFVGYAVVDFAPESAAEPLIDSEFIPRGSEEPELFIALASRHRAGIGGYAVVQLPLERVLSGHATSLRAALPAPAPAPAVNALEQKLKQQESWISELEARAETADERADVAEDELERLREELARKVEVVKMAPPVAAPPAVAPRPIAAPAPDPAWLGERRALTQEIEATRTRVRELEAKLGERDAARAVLEGAIAERDARIEELSRRAKEDAAKEKAAKDDAAKEDPSDVDALERKLIERGHELRRLERDLAEAERLGRELVLDLADARERGGPELREELALIADQLAKSEADRLALNWAAAVTRSS